MPCWFIFDNIHSRPGLNTTIIQGFPLKLTFLCYCCHEQIPQIPTVCSFASSVPDRSYSSALQLTQDSGYTQIAGTTFIFCRHCHSMPLTNCQNSGGIPQAIGIFISRLSCQAWPRFSSGFSHLRSDMPCQQHEACCSNKFYLLFMFGFDVSISMYRSPDPLQGTSSLKARNARNRACHFAITSRIPYLIKAWIALRAISVSERPDILRKRAARRQNIRWHWWPCLSTEKTTVSHSSAITSKGLKAPRGLTLILTLILSARLLAVSVRASFGFAVISEWHQGQSRLLLKVNQVSVKLPELEANDFTSLTLHSSSPSTHSKIHYLPMAQGSCESLESQIKSDHVFYNIQCGTQCVPNFGPFPSRFSAIHTMCDSKLMWEFFLTFCLLKKLREGLQ